MNPFESMLAAAQGQDPEDPNKMSQKTPNPLKNMDRNFACGDPPGGQR